MTTRRLRVLLVDDEAPLRRALARVLADCDISHAADGVEALAELVHKEFDAIVTDLDMPRMTGDELIAHIETKHPALAPCVVILTGGASAPARQTLIERFDAARVLRKPVDAERVLNAIRLVAKR